MERARSEALELAAGLATPCLLKCMTPSQMSGGYWLVRMCGGSSPVVSLGRRIALGSCLMVSSIGLLAFLRSSGSCLDSYTWTLSN